MYTAQEMLDAVALQKSLEIPVNSGAYYAINRAMVEHANSGWLCLNASRYAYITKDLMEYYRGLGYRVDRDGIIYWMYHQ